MLIHQATYGEDRGGHALLAKSGDESSPSGDVTWRTDLPGTAPSGLAWEPYVSGFPDHNYYVLTKTFPDPSASRGGMVFTHALFLPLANAVQLADLGAIAALLPQQPSKAGSLTPLRSETVPENPLSTCRERGTPKGLGALVEALLLGDKSPVVWVGQEGFEEAIFALWGQLWSEIRSAFSFRLSFGPQDTQDLVPTVVSTLAPLESRWAGYSTVHATEVPHNETDASKLLLGLAEGQKLRSFANEIQASLVSLSDLKLLESSRRYADDQSLGGDGLLALVRLLARLSPMPLAGVSVKRDAVERLTHKIRQMTAAEISSMRNLDVAAFADGDKVWTAVASWVQRSAAENETPTQVATLLSQAAGADTPWARAVWKGIDGAIAQQVPPLATSIWNWWQKDATLVEKLFPRLPLESATENRLCDAFPEEIEPNLAKAIMEHAVGRNWYRLHGMTAASQFDPRVAVEWQLAVDHDPAYLGGLKAVLARASGHDIVSSALQSKNSRLITLAADASAKQPELFRDLVPDDATWQQIWVGAISRNQEAWKGPSDPQSVMQCLLDTVLNGGSVPERVLDCLARTPLGDLSYYPRRSEIWSRFPASCLQPFLERTADGWLSRFKKDVQFDLVVEPQLQSVLLREPQLSSFLQSLIPADVAVGAHFFMRFTSLTQVQFDSWLITVERRVRNIAFPDARLLGRLVAARQWQRIAERMANDIRQYSRNDLKAALQECHQVLGLWEKVRLRLLGGVDVPVPTTDQLWDLFIQTVVELYPKGPTEDEIWSRSGGKESALRHEGTGESRWRDAFRLLRHSGGGDITAAKLLSEIRRDYAGNERVKWLIQQREFEDSHSD
jgi:GTPase-associated protein 1, N-terminal domain type 1/Effector-associated domain 1